MSGTERAPREPFPARYDSLDAWRGIAAVLVLFHHELRFTHPDVRCLFLGVQLFFVISGYCLATALDRSTAQGMTWGEFMGRRVRRIGPPYLGSVALGVVAQAIVFGRGAFVKPWYVWIQNLTLTQWLTVLVGFVKGERYDRPAFANDVLIVGPHWSLDYEEQFYLLMATLGALAAFIRTGRSLLLVTLVALFVNWRLPGAVTGVFTDYWVQFALGILVYYRLVRVKTVSAARLVDLGLVVACVVSAGEAWARGELRFAVEKYQYFGQLTITTAFALLLVALRPLDARASSSRLLRPVFALGWVSYSLYLVHLPFIAATERDRFRIESAALREVVILGGLALVTVLFYFALERPFLNRKRTAPT